MPRPPTEPPYLQIAEALRRRIERGELPAGSKVPSTRELSRQWKVANATAAHALKWLAEEGLVRPLPRSGNVVCGPLESDRSMRATVPRAPELTRDRILRAAMKLADREGLQALSIRSLAAQLETPAMSLYRHVRSKEELIALMTDAALGEEPLPAKPPNGWRAQLEVAARAEWRVFRRHPWLARVVHIIRPSAMPNALSFADWVLRALDRSGLSAAAKLQIHVVLHGFVQGLAVNLEAEAQAIGETGISEDDHMRRNDAAFRALAASGQFPYFAKLITGAVEAVELDFNRLFELGLSALLDGFTPLIERGRPRLGR